MIIGWLPFLRDGLRRMRPRPLVDREDLGEDEMRSNSGKDQSRDNLHDPTLRERDLGRGNPTTAEKKPKAPADHRTGRKD
jgi:hypothetical protein